VGKLKRKEAGGMGFRVGNRDGGASLVEFALLMPLLLLLVLGVIEFGYILGQYNEIRHGAHEGSRLAAVNDGDLVNKTCDSMGLGSDVTVDFGRTGNGIGDQASVTVSKSVDSLSGVGLIASLLPANLSTTAEFRLEQQATWPTGSQSC
jgi:Flp pilus assembly protein TadG